MRTIKLTIAYDGTNFKGWQIQPNARTVQEEIEKAIEKVFRSRVKVYSASRTDAGVHAKAQTAHFKLKHINIPGQKIKVALNSILPEDIVIKKSEYVQDDFHARFNAVSKVYRYFIYNSVSRDPFLERYSWRVGYKLDIKRMNSAACTLLGRHDFKSFQAVDKKRKNFSVREVKDLKVIKKNSHIIIQIEADGFLYNMVRNIAGTLVDVARGYIKEDGILEILLSRDRRKAGVTAPPKGLFLMKVNY
ncbi:tRNA pseudouridine synthase A [Candidatus Omnitrophus magneticus]|uniref:tRNA pseudouridine synthase A n=1 Tax=Candidatus Omnitrophus magneticus TaxID=1609969 RepID=A0A0F0CUE8_9BACT|nr:tRNA pseudouridine synthase A [Candidatus Omnitrophus magneticus]